MIYSMTGFGRAGTDSEGKTITVDIRSLNSKQADIGLRLPSIYKEKEIELRSLITEKLSRGKIDVTIQRETASGEPAIELNKKLALEYFGQIKSLEQSLDLENGLQTDYIPTLLRLPDVMKPLEGELGGTEYKQLLQTLEEALKAINEFRSAEGRKLEEELVLRVKNILACLEQTESYEGERIETIKNRLQQNLRDLALKEQVDQNRFEQELIYYIEKIDITEEKVRLRTHCDYFLETMKNESPAGKKLNFISQEMGREINTLGSKAQHAEMQKLVVQMKDELEKIKEQTLNVL